MTKKAYDLFEFWDQHLSRSWIGEKPLGIIGNILIKEVHSLCYQMIYDAAIARHCLTQDICGSRAARDTLIEVGKEKGMAPLFNESDESFGRRILNAKESWSKAGTYDMLDLFNSIRSDSKVNMIKNFPVDYFIQHIGGGLMDVTSSANWPSQFALTVKVDDYKETGAIDVFGSNSRLINKYSIDDLQREIKQQKPVDQVCRFIRMTCEKPIVSYTDPINKKINEVLPQQTTRVGEQLYPMYTHTAFRNKFYFDQGSLATGGASIVECDYNGMNQRIIFSGLMQAMHMSCCSSAPFDIYENGWPIIWVIEYVGIPGVKKLSKIYANYPYSPTLNKIRFHDITESFHGYPWAIAGSRDHRRPYIATSNGLYREYEPGYGPSLLTQWPNPYNYNDVKVVYDEVNKVENVWAVFDFEPVPGLWASFVYKNGQPTIIAPLGTIESIAPTADGEYVYVNHYYDGVTEIRKYTVVTGQYVVVQTYAPGEVQNIQCLYPEEIHPAGPVYI